MPAHQAHADLQVALDRLGRQVEHLAGARAVDGRRLFHEDIEVLGNCIAELNPAKRGRGRQQHDVSRLEAVHRLLVTVEADELAVIGDVDLQVTFAVGFEVLVTVGELLGEDVGHGDQLRGAGRGRQGVLGRPRSASAASDQRQLNRIALARIQARQNGIGQSRRRRDFTRRLEKFAARETLLRGIAHGKVPWNVMIGLRLLR